MVTRSKQFMQLCWKCEYACDISKCMWVRTLTKRYKETKVDEDGYIIECPKFKHDKFLYDDKERAEALGVSLSSYLRIKATIRQKELNITPEEYFYIREKKKKEREKFSSLSIEEQKRLKNFKNNFYKIMKNLKK